MDIPFRMEELWQEYNLDRLEEGLDAMFPETGASFGEVFSKVVSGDIAGALSGVFQALTGGLGSQIAGMKNVLIWLLVLGIASSILFYFADVFDRKQVSDLSFYVMYLLLSAVLLKCFEQAASTASGVMEDIVLFVKFLIPTYMILVGAASGTATASAYYQLLLLIVYGVENILASGAVSLVYGYCMLAVVNGVWVEQKLTMLMELLAKAVRALLKAAVGIVTGIGVFQAMVTPVLDSVKSSALKKAFQALPGVGNVADGVVELAAGGAAMIKNSLGVVFLILLLALCGLPFIRIFMIAGLLKVAAAVMGIVSDKRLSTCTDRIGEGSMLLLKTAGTAMLLFLITVSMAAAVTNRGF